MAITFDGQNDRITTSSQGLTVPSNVAGTFQAGGLAIGAGGTVLTTTLGGNIGIGSAIPIYKLDISGSSRINGSITGVSSITDSSGGYLSLPPGLIMWFAASSAPLGFIKCNGASLSTSSYSALFNAIQYTHGGSGGSFNVPDLRGEFIRGWDDSRGVDSGRSFATSQAEMINQHRHWVSAAAIDDRNFTGSGGNTQDLGLVSDAGSYSSTDPNSGAGRFTRNDPGFGSNNETRPRNIALLACIKY